jgi:hypothetical protein
MKEDTANTLGSVVVERADWGIATARITSKTSSKYTIQ